MQVGRPRYLHLIVRNLSTRLINPFDVGFVEKLLAHESETPLYPFSLFAMDGFR